MKEVPATDQKVSLPVQEWGQFVSGLRERPNLSEDDFKKGLALRQLIEDGLRLLPGDRVAKIEWEVASIDDQFRFFTKVSATSSQDAKPWWESRVPLSWGSQFPKQLGGPEPPLTKQKRIVRATVAAAVLCVIYFFWVETKISVAVQCVLLLHSDALRFKEVNHRWPRTKDELGPLSISFEVRELDPTFQPVDENQLIVTTNAWGFFGRTRRRYLMTAHPMRVQELPIKNGVGQGH